MNPPNDIFDINAGAILTLEIKTNSRNPITYRVYDKETRVPVPINGKMSVSLTPKDSKNVVDELVIEQGGSLPTKWVIFFITVCRLISEYYIKVREARPTISKGRGWMEVSRHRRGDFDHFESS